MNNEPVAWMDKRTSKCVVFINTPPSDDWIPLYTHSADLTDEEILSLCSYKYSTIHSNDYVLVHGFFQMTKEDVLNFARAILRKAQEK